MDKSHVNYWQIVWFFSMEERDQEALLGSTEKPWFIEEDKDNLGANYLIGLCLRLSEGFRPFSPYADELRDAVLSAAEHLEPEFWIFRSLSTTPEWRRARTAAAKLLSAENPRVTPPRKPFVIEDLIHVDHYLHASAIRGRPRKWSPKKVTH
jgi:hypothetical protein